MTARPRTVRALLLAATAVVGALLLAGCVPTEVPRALSTPSTAAAVGSSRADPVADDAATGAGSSTTVPA